MPLARYIRPRDEIQWSRDHFAKGQQDALEEGSGLVESLLESLIEMVVELSIDENSMKI